jgi:transposase-like protein
MDREERIANAIEALESGKFSKVREAAREYEVHRSTLTRRRNGATTHHHAHVDQQTFNKGEEAALIAYIQRCDAQGFPIRHGMLREAGEYLLQKRDSDPRRRTLSAPQVSKAWSTRFVKRHPFLQTVMSKPREQSRANACTRENLLKWFEVFKNTMDKYKFDIGNIYNIDETGFQIGTTSKSYVIVDKRQNTSGKAGSGSKGENVTAIETGCADGTVLPPFLIFKGQYLQSTWYSHDVPGGWVAVTSPNGWTTDLLAMGWLKRIFEPHTRDKARGKHRLIILDGHGSHLTPEFMEYCFENCTTALCLPAHTSHLTQPMDVSVFSSIKHWF